MILLLSVLTGSCRHLRGNFLLERSCLFARWLSPRWFPAGRAARASSGWLRVAQGGSGWPWCPRGYRLSPGALEGHCRHRTVTLGGKPGLKIFEYFLVLNSPRAIAGSPCGTRVPGSLATHGASPSPTAAFRLWPRSPAGTAASPQARAERRAPSAVR